MPPRPRAAHLVVAFGTPVAAAAPSGDSTGPATCGVPPGSRPAEAEE